jgi:hypothetical protein
MLNFFAFRTAGNTVHGCLIVMPERFVPTPGLDLKSAIREGGRPGYALAYGHDGT